uniref:Uncharacterized protein n=1 Tax=Anopheles minimus TaxID=112268 RepID=A0A182WQ56_9DIPT
MVQRWAIVCRGTNSTDECLAGSRNLAVWFEMRARVS